MIGWWLAHWQDGGQKNKAGIKNEPQFLSTPALKGAPLKKEQRIFFPLLKVVAAITVLEWPMGFQVEKRAGYEFVIKINLLV